MTLIIYQIGDLPIHGVAVGIDSSGIRIDRKRKWRNPTETLTDVGGVYSTLPLTRDLPEDATIKLQLNIIASENMNLDNIYHGLHSLGGRRNTPIIGYEIENQVDFGETCDDDITWLKNICVVESIDCKYEYASEKEPFNLDYLTVGLDLFLGVQWEVLNPWIWEYRSWRNRLLNPFSLVASQEGFDTYFHHPEKFNEIVKDSYFFRWDFGSLFDFNPTYWGLRYSEGRTGGVGTDWTSFGKHVVNADPLRWSGKTRSLYAFTGLSSAGTIYITSKTATGYFQGDYEDQVSSLDLSTLDADLISAGYVGLQADDIIIAGFADPSPGFVIRDDVIIEDVRPQWSYPGTYPGEIGRAYTEVTTSASGTGGQVAYLHEFGVY